MQALYALVIVLFSFAVPAQTLEVNEADDVAITGPNGAENVPVGAIQVRDEKLIAAILSRSDDQSTVEDTMVEDTIE